MKHTAKITVGYTDGDVPHNIADLIELMGGKEAFRNNLETMYNTPLGEAKYVFYAQLPDHTGNVGQFSMANEPGCFFSRTGFVLLFYPHKVKSYWVVPNRLTG